MVDGEINNKAKINKLQKQSTSNYKGTGMAFGFGANRDIVNTTSA